MSAWFVLILAGFLEVGFTSMMKLSDGMKNWIYIPPFAIFAIASFLLLNKALSEIPMGTAYAVWTGIGAFGTAIVGMLFFGESTSLSRVFFLFTLIGSIVALKFVAPGK